MGMDEFEEAVKLIEQNDALAFFQQPQPEELIVAAERALGLEFPPTYRAFLKRFGCGTFGADEFYGVWEEMEQGVPNVVWLTLSERDSAGLAPHLIWVHSRGDGTSSVIDTRHVTAAVFFWHSEDEEPEWVAGDFGCFLLERVELQLEIAAEDEDDDDE